MKLIQDKEFLEEIGNIEMGGILEIEKFKERLFYKQIEEIFLKHLKDLPKKIPSEANHVKDSIDGYNQCLKDCEETL